MKIEKNPKASTKAAAELTEIIPALKPNHAAGVLNYLVPSIRIITTCRDASNACVVLYSEDVLNELRTIASEVHAKYKDLSPLNQANKFMLEVADGRFNFRTDTVTATFAIVGSIEKNFEGLYQSYEIKSIVAKLIEAMPDDQGYVAVFYANQVYLNDAAKKHIYEQFKQLAATKQEQLNKLKDARIDNVPSYNGQTDMFEDGLSKETLKALEDFYVKIMQCCHSGWIRYIARNIVRHIPEEYKSNAAVLVKTYCELLQDAKKLKMDNGYGIETAIKQIMMSKFGVEYKITAKYESSSKKIVVMIRGNKIELSKSEAKSIVEQLFNTDDNAVQIRGVRIILSQIEKKRLVSDIMSSV